MRNKVTVKTIPFENGDAPLVMDPFSSARIARPPKIGRHMKTNDSRIDQNRKTCCCNSLFLDRCDIGIIFIKIVFGKFFF